MLRSFSATTTESLAVLTGRQRTRPLPPRPRCQRAEYERKRDSAHDELGTGAKSASERRGGSAAPDSGREQR
jgi:hypothetical protein